MERRRVYRVSVKEPDRMRLFLETAEGTRFRGQLFDVSLLGAGARFEGDRVPKLDLGEIVTLRLETTEDSGSFSIRARTRSIFWVRDYERYGFEFEDPQELQSGLAARSFQWFNRRRAPRARPAEGQNVAVTVRDALGNRWHGRMADVSAAGISLRFDAHSDPALGDDAAFKITFRLPGQERELGLQANLRRRERQAEGVLYGLEFDSGLTDDFKEMSEAIDQFVLGRLTADAPGRERGNNPNSV